MDCTDFEIIKRDEFGTFIADNFSIAMLSRVNSNGESVGIYLIKDSIEQPVAILNYNPETSSKLTAVSFTDEAGKTIYQKTAFYLNKESFVDSKSFFANDGDIFLFSELSYKLHSENAKDSTYFINILFKDYISEKSALAATLKFKELINGNVSAEIVFGNSLTTPIPVDISEKEFFENAEVFGFVGGVL